jgi:4-aminobutyrate aminotransferase-like enzyme
MSGWKFNLEPMDVPKVETKYRKIVTKIPVPESLDYFKALDEYESTAMHGQMPVVWDRAKGFQVSDAWGNTWIDFTSTIFVANAGHGNTRIVNAVREQLDKPLLHTYTFASKIRTEYLKYLIEVTPKQFEKAFLLSAGTEATECALKLMRMNGQKAGKRKPGIISFEGNWHGRTMGAQMMSFNPSQKEWIGYQDPNIYHLPFPYPWREDAMRDPRGYFCKAMEEMLSAKKIDPDNDLCGFMIETMQGWGAVSYPPEFVNEIASFAKEHGMLVAFDEMQAGFGRTGKLFGYMNYGIEPDILCCGKGASSGFQLSIVLGSKNIMDLPEIGSMSSTHSANPIVCAAGLANLQVLFEDGLIENAKRLGELFFSKLNEIKGYFPSHVRWVLGKGLYAAMIFADDGGKPLSELCNNICQEAMRKGLLVVHTGRESIKLAPPLCISEEAMLEGLDVLQECVEKEVGCL